MKRWVAAGALGLVFVSAIGGVWSWLRSRDERYDDDREIARYAARPPSALVVPDDVELVTVDEQPDPINPAVLQVSLGKRELRVQDRVALTLSPDGAVGYGLNLIELGPMLDWGAKLDLAVDASSKTVNVLVDHTKYEQMVPLLYTLGQHEFSSARLVVRGPTGIGSISTSAPHVSDGRALVHSVCLVPDGVRLDTHPRHDKVAERVGAGCVVGAPGPVAKWTGTGFDVASYRACFATLEGYSPEQNTGLDMQTGLPTAMPAQPVIVGATPSITFEQMLQARQQLEKLGLAPDWGMPCEDGPGDASVPLPTLYNERDHMEGLLLRAFGGEDAGADVKAHK